MSPDEADRLKAVEARVDALSSTVKSVLTTLVLRGLLNRADVAALLQETTTVLQAECSTSAGLDEIKAIEVEMPTYLRAAVGPPPTPDEDDH
jgi:hypothetical protein